MGAGNAKLVGDLQQAVGARIARRMLRMAQPRHLALCGFQSFERINSGLSVAPGGHDLGKIAPCNFRRAGHDSAHAEKAGGHGALPGLGAGRERHSRGLDGGDEPVFGNRHEAGIHRRCLALIRPHPADQQPEIVGEVDFADQIAAKVLAADRDRMLVRRGNRRKGAVLFSNPHRLSFSDSENKFTCRIVRPVLAWRQP